MIKKFFYLLLLLIVAGLIVLSTIYNGDVVINWLDYQLKTSTTTFFIVYVISVIIILLFLRIISIIISPNMKRRERKLRLSYQRHLQALAEGFIYMILGDYKRSEEKQKQSLKYLKHSVLAELLKARILHKQKKYQESARIFNEIEIPNVDTNFIALKLKFLDARKANDTAGIKKYAEQILLVQPNHEKAIEALYKTYRNERNWAKTEEFLNRAIDLKIIHKEDHEREIAFVYTCVARDNFSKGNFSNTIKYTKKVYKILPGFIPANILMAEAYLKLNKNRKALSTIRKSWKIKPHPKLAELYMKVYKNKGKEAKFRVAKKLYKTNTHDFASNLFMAKVAFATDNIIKARKYAKKALMLSENREIYQLLVDIEMAEDKNSTLAKSLLSKIKTVKKGFGWKCDKCAKEYEDWHHECADCKELDKIQWVE